MRAFVAAMLFICQASTQAAWSADAPKTGRLEARSDTFLAVAVVNGEHLSIHVSRLADNAPLTDATVTVMLRGTSHPAVAEPDGSYSLTDKDLALPGAAAVEFQVAEGALHETLKATLEQAGPASGSSLADQGNARQMFWWVLNFAAVGGFLWLLSRRKKKTPEE